MAQLKSSLWRRTSPSAGFAAGLFIGSSQRPLLLLARRLGRGFPELCREKWCRCEILRGSLCCVSVVLGRVSSFVPSPRWRARITGGLTNRLIMLPDSPPMIMAVASSGVSWRSACTCAWRGLLRDVQSGAAQRLHWRLAARSRSACAGWQWSGGKRCSAGRPADYLGAVAGVRPKKKRVTWWLPWCSSDALTNLMERYRALRRQLLRRKYQFRGRGPRLIRQVRLNTASTLDGHYAAARRWF